MCIIINFINLVKFFKVLHNFCLILKKLYVSRCSVPVYTLHRVRFYEMICMKHCILSLKQRTMLINLK